MCTSENGYGIAVKEGKKNPQLVSFCILKMSEPICCSVTLGLCKANPHNQPHTTKCTYTHQHSVRFPGACLHTSRSHRLSQETWSKAEWFCHLKDVKGDVPVTIKAFLSAPPITNHFQNCSWLFNFFHL